MIVVTVFICQSLNAKVLHIKSWLYIFPQTLLHFTEPVRIPQLSLHPERFSSVGKWVLQIWFEALPGGVFGKCHFWAVISIAGRGWTEFLLSQSCWHWIPSLLWRNGYAEMFRWIQWGVFVSRECLATAAVSGLSWQGGDQSKAGLNLGALFLQDVSVGCCRCLPMALMLQFQPGYPSVSIFHTDTWGCKKPDLSILCQIIIDSGESLFMQWVIPLISVGGPRCRSANPECWGNNTFFFL